MVSSYNHNVVIEKLVSLRERVLRSPLDNTKDLLWCKRLIEDAKESGLIPDKQEFIMANLMWKKYSGGVPINEKTIWILIDALLEQGTKIGAIKMYRRFINSSLREAKDVVDAREEKIKRGW